MKTIFIIIIANTLLYPLEATCQKEGDIWLNGTDAGINFNSGSAAPFKANFPDIWRTDASICDSNGSLLFFTNGFRIFNKSYQIMQNGDSLNIGDYLSFGYDELPVPDGAIILPVPGTSGKYYLIHTELKYINDSAFGTFLQSCNLYYNIIDMSLGGGLGAVVSGEKEILFFSDTLTNTGVQAVKHGNGMDWWLLCHEYGSNTYCRFLITSKGITGPFFQNTGMIYIRSNAYGYFSNIKISRDGAQLIKNNSDSTAFELYDLNRCSGELSNRRQVQVSDTLYQLSGVSFSPGGRYAYISANLWRYLFQFDLQSKNIDSSKVLLAIWDGTYQIGPTNFYDHALGPDSKIYISNYSYNNTLHVINDPDSPGLKCNFVQNQFKLDSGSYWGMGFPNLPNYDLGPLIGSGCDTVITNLPPTTESAFTHGIYPNPSTGKFQLSITGIEQKVPIVIYNEMGEVVFQTTLQPTNGFIHGFFNLKNQSAGVYFLKAQTNRGEVTEKILKQ